MDPPNVTGHRYYYDKAVASALKDIKGAIDEGVKSLPQLVRNSIDHFNVYIKDGGDGLGDMKKTKSNARCILHSQA